MEIVILILKVLVYVYFGARTVLVLDKSKVLFDKLNFKGNQFLKSIRDEEVEAVLWQLRAFLIKVNIGVFIIICLGVFVFQPPSKEFIGFWYPAFGILAITIFSISWNLTHKEVVAKYILSGNSLLLVSSPFLLAAAVEFLNLPVDQSIARIMSVLELGVWSFAAFISISFAVMYVLLPYIVAWLVCYPIFYIEMALIYLMQQLLKFIEVWATTNLLDAVVFILGLILVFY
jgi:hypothetical protein